MSLLFFLHFNDHAPAVITAFGADAMRQARFVAVRTVAGRRGRQMVMRATFAGARLGMFPFRIWHKLCSLMISINKFAD